MQLIISLIQNKGQSCDVQAMSKLVKETIHNVKLKVTKSELVFNMPVNEVGNFPGLFEKLDNAKKDLDVFNISIKVTTMEDVFLKVGKMTEEADGGSEENASNGRPLLRTQRYAQYCIIKYWFVDTCQGSCHQKPILQFMNLKCWQISKKTKKTQVFFKVMNKN